MQFVGDIWGCDNATLIKNNDESAPLRSMAGGNSVVRSGGVDNGVSTSLLGELERDGRARLWSVEDGLIGNVLGTRRGNVRLACGRGVVATTVTPHMSSDLHFCLSVALDVDGEERVCH